jgi:F-type H+-transporting ATPase subunit gamma
MSERLSVRLEDNGFQVAENFAPPYAIGAISGLITQIVAQLEPLVRAEKLDALYLFHNAPQPGAAYKPVLLRLLPLDQTWLQSIRQRPWPTRCQPEVVLDSHLTRQVLLTEHLFLSLYRACAESLASENAARLAAMQRAEKNIGEMQDNLTHAFHRLRQDSIDAELFDVCAGFEALQEKEK